MRRHGRRTLAVSGVLLLTSAGVAAAANPAGGATYRATVTSANPQYRSESFTVSRGGRELSKWLVHTSGTCTVNGAASSYYLNDNNVGEKAIPIHDGRFNATHHGSDTIANASGTATDHYVGRFTSKTSANVTITISFNSASGGAGGAVGNVVSCYQKETFTAKS
jgi:hypothetical protein